MEFYIGVLLTLVVCGIIFYRKSKEFSNELSKFKSAYEILTELRKFELFNDFMNSAFKLDLDSNMGTFRIYLKGSDINWRIVIKTVKEASLFHDEFSNSNEKYFNSMDNLYEELASKWESIKNNPELLENIAYRLKLTHEDVLKRKEERRKLASLTPKVDEVLVDHKIIK